MTSPPMDKQEIRIHTLRIAAQMISRGVAYRSRVPSEEDLALEAALYAFAMKLERRAAVLERRMRPVTEADRARFAAESDDTWYDRWKHDSAHGDADHVIAEWLATH